MRHLILEYLIRRLLREEEFTSLNVRSFQGPTHSTRTTKFVDAISSYDEEHKPKSVTLTKGGETGTIKSVRIIKKDELAAKKTDPNAVIGTTYNTDDKAKMDQLKLDLPKLTSGDKLSLIDSNNKEHNITTVAKTKELGGKGKGGTLGPERAAIASLQKQFEEIGGPITIEIGGASYSGITGVTNVKENQKADFAFTNATNPVIFISYKPGSSAKGIISYGGITSISAKSRDVQKFVKAVKEKAPDFEGLGVEFSVPVNDKGVALRAMYGSDFGKAYGLNNVQAILQGDIILEKQSNGNYALVSNHSIIPPSVPSDEYAPVLNARYASDRNQFGIKHCRVGIIPAGARSNTKSPYEDVQTKRTT